MNGKREEPEYSQEEAQRRFEAALRGARMVGHKPESAFHAIRKKRKKRSAAKRKTSTPRA